MDNNENLSSNYCTKEYLSQAFGWFNKKKDHKMTTKKKKKKSNRNVKKSSPHHCHQTVNTFLEQYFCKWFFLEIQYPSYNGIRGEKKSHKNRNLTTNGVGQGGVKDEESKQNP